MLDSAPPRPSVKEAMAELRVAKMPSLRAMESEPPSALPEMVLEAHAIVEDIQECPYQRSQGRISRRLSVSTEALMRGSAIANRGQKATE